MKTDINSKQFNINMVEKYPELYEYIVQPKKLKKHKLGYRLPIVDFMNKHDIHRDASYGFIWDYIVANEDMHEWWML